MQSFIAGNKIKKRWKPLGSKTKSWHTNLKLRNWRSCFNRCLKTRTMRVTTRVRIKIQRIENSFHEKMLNIPLPLYIFLLFPLLILLSCLGTVDQNRPTPHWFCDWPPMSHYPGAQILWRCLCVFPPLPWSPPITVRAVSHPGLVPGSSRSYDKLYVQWSWHWMLFLVSSKTESAAECYVCLYSFLQDGRDRLLHLRFCIVQSVSGLLQLVAASQ